MNHKSQYMAPTSFDCLIKDESSPAQRKLTLKGMPSRSLSKSPLNKRDKAIMYATILAVCIPLIYFFPAESIRDALRKINRLLGKSTSSAP